MIAATDEQIEALASLHEQMPEEFHKFLCMVATNAHADNKAATARGASVAREENCGRAQVWQEVQELLAGAKDRFKMIEQRRKQAEKEKRELEDAEAGEFRGPYEEPLNQGF